MKKSRVKPHQIDEQVFDSKVSRRDLIQGTLLSTVAAPALVEAAEPSAHQGGDPKAEVEEIERKLMWLYSNDLPKHVNEIMEYFDDTPEMLQFDVMSPRERHAGHDRLILARRHQLYTRARAANPRRWARHTRNWQPIAVVTLNLERESVVNAAVTAEKESATAA
jgi:hypothetical protein